MHVKVLLSFASCKSVLTLTGAILQRNRSALSAGFDQSGSVSALTHFSIRTEQVCPFWRCADFSSGCRQRMQIVAEVHKTGAG